MCFYKLSLDNLFSFFTFGLILVWEKDSVLKFDWDIQAWELRAETYKSEFK